MNYVTFNNGLKIPILGFCTYGIPKSQTKQAVLDAIKIGYRSIDTAQFNGNEAETGAAIKESNVGRESLFVTSKAQTNGYSETKREIDNSLTRAGLDYFDLMLLHWPMPDTLGSYQALEDASKEGKICSIGLSNFNIRQTQEVIAHSRIKPVIDEIETHIFLQQRKIHQFLSDNQMIHEAYAPFAENINLVLNHPVLKELGAKYHKTPLQVVLRFLIQEQIIVNARSTDYEHMRENFEIFDFELNVSDIQKVRLLEEHRPIIDWPSTMHIDE